MVPSTTPPYEKVHPSPMALQVTTQTSPWMCLQDKGRKENGCERNHLATQDVIETTAVTQTYLTYLTANAFTKGKRTLVFLWEQVYFCNATLLQRFVQAQWPCM